MSDALDWIAVDWGTSRLRAWALAVNGEVLQHASSDQGMGPLTAEKGDFEDALLALIHDWLPSDSTTPVIACGMVGARQGWIEVPYESVPCQPVTRLTAAPTRSTSIEFWIHSGLSQDSPADVMRGEETQVAGLLAATPDFEGLVCLPGTHTKWVQVRQGRIERFRTYLTGEAWTLLAEQSVLRLTLSRDGWDESAFLDAFNDAFARPQAMLADCFSLRAEALLHDLDGAAARSRLSGILLGVELADALKEDSPPPPVALVSSPSNGAMYQLALETIGVDIQSHETDSLTLAGLSAGRRQISARR